MLCRWSLQYNVPATSFSAVRTYSTQAAEDKEEEPLHTIISDTENVKGGHRHRCLVGALLGCRQTQDNVWVQLCPA